MLCVAPEDVRSTLDELERASLLQMLPEMSGAETGEGLRNTGKMTRVYRLSDFFAAEFIVSDHSPLLHTVFLCHLLSPSSQQLLASILLCLAPQHIHSLYDLGGGRQGVGRRALSQFSISTVYNAGFPLR